MIRWGLVGKLGCGLGCLVGITALIVVGPGLIFGLLLFAASERTIYDRAKSPDGATEARVQFDDAGAVTGWSKTVFVRPAWLPLDTPWFSCPAFWGDGTDRIRLEWRDSSTLMVRHGFARNEINGRQSKCGSIRIVPVFDSKLISEEP